ncbi:hypothetical protein SBBP1_640049 [Burkholderiales bacterium]|nr:hypothetical protein SBBP1_640049 [Burkholderiales bacterium]
MGRLVKLRLIHENLLPEDMETDPNPFRGINNGGPAVLSSLKSLLETADPISFCAPGKRNGADTAGGFDG